MRKIYLLFSLFVLPLTVMSQVSVGALIDSVQIYVGEQAHITLKASIGNKQKVQFPVLKEKEIVPGLEVVEESGIDTVLINDGNRLQLTKSYTVTAFDSAFFYLPPFSLTVDGKRYDTKNLALKVFTVEVDTLHTDKFFGPNDIMNAPFSWEDWQGVFVQSCLLLVLFVLTVYLWIRVSDNKPIVRRVTLAPVVPPHQWAMTEIEKIKTDVDLKDENSKEYYTKLTDTIRTYIARRYGFNAKEMTSHEIIEKLLSIKDRESLSELRDLLTTADMVKFAKFHVSVAENDSNLIKAVDFINSTKDIQVKAKPEPKVVNIEEKRSKKASLIMKISIAATSLIMLYICYQTARDLYNLLF